MGKTLKELLRNGWVRSTIASVAILGGAYTLLKVERDKLSEGNFPPVEEVENNLRFCFEYDSIMPPALTNVTVLTEKDNPKRIKEIVYFQTKPGDIVNRIVREPKNYLIDFLRDSSRKSEPGEISEYLSEGPSQSEMLKYRTKVAEGSQTWEKLSQEFSERAERMLNKYNKGREKQK